MAKQSGLGDAFIIGGNVLSNDISAVDKISGGPQAELFTGIDKFAIERQGVLRDGSLDFTAFYNDTTVTGEHAVLKGLPTTDTLMTYLRGTSLGGWCANLNAKQVNYDGTRAQNGAYTLKVNGVGNGYGLEWCQQLTAGVRTDTTATNGTSVDYGAVSTLFGAQAYLQVSSVVGTSVTVIVQDSADNTTFANVTGLSFTAVTPAAAPTFQRLATAGNATIRRYLRVITSGTFTSAVFQVGINRNEVATTF